MNIRKYPGHLRDVVLLAAAAAILLLSLSGIVLMVSRPSQPAADAGDAAPVPVSAPERLTVPDCAHDMLVNRAEEILLAMSDEMKVGQLLLIRSNGASLSEFAELTARCHAGGVVLFADDTAGQTPETMKAFVSTLQQSAGNRLLVCVDEEGGTVTRLSRNPALRSSRFQSPQQLFKQGGMDAIRADAAEKSDFLREYGINVNFAPVADVVTSPLGFLYKRSFGQGAEETAGYVSEVVSVMNEHRMGSCIKHFPGYGNSSGDTHNGLVVVDTSEQDIRQRELLPFAAGIAAGADSVMVTHTVLSSIDAERPATLSPAVISILRSDLGFEGVIISDAMDMGAIAEYTGGKDACVAGFLAGLDMLCTPADAAAAYSALLDAVRSGVISAERLDESVMRIIMWKISLGLY